MKKITNIFLSTILVTSSLLSTITYAGETTQTTTTEVNETTQVTEDSYTLAIPYKFDEVSEFSEGLALARDDKMLGYINTDGEYVINISKFSNGGDFHEGFARLEKDGKVGFMNTSADIIVPLEYDSAYDFSNGYAVVEKDGLFGYVGTDGELLTPIQYTFASSFDEEGDALVCQDSVYRLIDKTGQVTQVYDNATVVYPFSEGYAAFLGDFGYGYMDKQGNEVIEQGYDAAMFFKDGLAPVFMYPLWQFVTPQGEVVGQSYESCDIFSDGMAKVSRLGDLGYINTNGELVFKVDYEYSMPFNDGLSAIKKDDKGGFIDKTGEIVIPLDFVEVSSFSNGYAPVYDGTKWGFITSPLDTFDETAVSYDYQTSSGSSESMYIIISMIIMPLIFAFIAAVLFSRRK